MIDLSILICSTHTRWQTFGQAIQKQVWSQYDALSDDYKRRIEILILTDAKTMMLGHKRNIMVDAAQGRYVQFIDDDDRIEPDMFRTLLDATSSNADVIAFLVSVSLNGEEPRICKYSKDFHEDKNTDDGYERLPNHICCVKREIALKASFPNLPYGEDSAYSKLLHPHLKTERHIDRVLYHYDYSGETTEAQQHLRAPVRRTGRRPLVDVVILSNARPGYQRIMTQKAIDTCIAGANSLPVNVIVMEQCGGTYQNATTVKSPEKFNYNQFANWGTEKGSAQWVMVANNDLIFHDGWLHHLLAANHPIVSPKCTRDARQAAVFANTAGYQNGVHFSGWCFMMTRELWLRIGKFDECVDFWCSDDVVIEQLRAVGVTPMIVPDSQVTHLRSKTLNTVADQDDLTWKQVDIFNRKYGQNKFADDARFADWKVRNRCL